MTDQGIGARLLRKEDDRYMRGRGQYVGDIRLPGMQEVAFLRSPLAHARIRGIRIPPAIRGRVFIAEDLVGVSAIRADTTLPGFKSSVQPVLATGKVRYVGELIAMCIAPTRAEAEDLAGEIELDLDALPVVADMLQARKAGAPLVHEHWGDNLFLTSGIDVDFEAVKAKAATSVTRELRTSRQVMSPLEGRGVVAQWHSRLGQLIVHTSTQQPHIVRSGLAECLGMDEGQIRVVAPDVGGGFGYKGILLPEEIALAWATRKLGAPLRWIEDRRESLTANANCREHHYILTAYADARRPPAGARLRGDRRFRRLLGLPVLRLPGGGADRLHPAGALRLPALPLPRLFGRHQQAADPALPRRRPHRRVLRAGGHARCARAQARPRVQRHPLQEPGAARADAVRQYRQAPLRFRRLPRGAAPGGRDRRPRQGARAAEGGRAGRAAHRHRLCHVLRAGRPRHQRVRRLGHPDGSGPRAVPRPLRAGRRARAARSAPTATARGWRPRCRRWRTRSSACRTSASSWCMATPPRRPTPRAPGARAA